MENKRKKKNLSFMNQNLKQGEIHSIKRKRDENSYDVKNGIQRMRQNNGFSDNYNHDNEHSNHNDGRRSNRIFLDGDGDGGDDENEYLNQERQKVPYLSRNNISQNNVKKTVNVKNQNWEDDDEDDDDDGYSDRGRISSGNHLMGKKTVVGGDSGREYDDVNGHGNKNERGKGKGSGDGGEDGDDRYRQNSGARREGREGRVHGQGERGTGQGVGDSVESAMVWAMALVGEPVKSCI